ncbi:MAG: polysaccharide deacetylase family protein [Bacteroidia bacterium]|nr:polysaccharide deacetylase family protein [Bacteroidia bacterium]
MLNFRNTNIFFISLLVVLIGVHISYGLPVYIYPLLFVVYSLIVFYGCYYVGSNFFIKIVCSAKTNQNEIAISFDDGPATNFTIEILQLLKQDNIKATFFCIGNRIAGNENIIKQIKDEGHIIGNHSYSHHFWFDMFSSKKMLEDMKRMDHEIKKVTGLRPKLFRPPYGVTNPNLKKAIIKGDYTPVGWSVRSMDTVIKDEKRLLRNITGSLNPGAVFLFHDTSKTTLNVLPEFIKEVKNKGYHIIPLDKLLHLNPYA